MSTATPIARGLLPERLIIPMAQQAGPAAIPVVEVGQRVRKGELIGRPGGLRSAGAHASTSGTVSAIRDGPAPTVSGLANSLCVHVETDGRDEPAPAGEWPGERNARIGAIRDAGIVGLGGAVFSTAEKLRGGAGCELLILNGAECEPYISCDDMLDAGTPSGGCARRAGHDGSGRGGVNRVRGRAGQAGRPEGGAGGGRPVGDTRIEFARVPTVYPAGGERQLVEALTGREVPSGGHPPAAGCICQNVGTAFALDRFIRRGEPLTSRIVTVTGGGVAEATNVDAPIGTPIRDLIEFCGGYRGKVTRLILGGNMMGYALPGDEVPVTKAGNCVVAAHPDEVRESLREWPCIRCGDCAAACPPRLLPQELLRASAVQAFYQLDALGLNDCIECGCCDVACPSQIALTERFRRAKQARAVATRRDAMADLADRRHRRKLARLAQRSGDIDRRHDELIAAVTGGDGRTMIEAAVARAGTVAKAKRSTDAI